jgi:hypothetical protein
MRIARQEQGILSLPKQEPRGAHVRARHPPAEGGVLAVRESTRRLRRMLRIRANGEARAKICFAAVVQVADRWHVRINVEAASLHPSLQHAPGAQAAPALGIGACAPSPWAPPSRRSARAGLGPGFTDWLLTQKSSDASEAKMAQRA